MEESSSKVLDIPVRLTDEEKEGILLGRDPAFLGTTLDQVKDKNLNKKRGFKVLAKPEDDTEGVSQQ